MYLRKKRKINKDGVAIGGSLEELEVEMDLEGEVGMDEEVHLMEESIWPRARAEEAAGTERIV